MIPTEKFIITGDCKGLTYYLGLKTNRGMYAPEFIWYGIMENATDFRSKEYAKKIMGEIFPFTKIDMTVRLYSTLSKKQGRKLAWKKRDDMNMLNSEPDVQVSDTTKDDSKENDGSQPPTTNK